MDQWIDEWMDGQTDGHSVLQRCKDASKNKLDMTSPISLIVSLTGLHRERKGTIRRIANFLISQLTIIHIFLTSCHRGLIAVTLQENAMKTKQQQISEPDNASSQLGEAALKSYIPGPLSFLQLYREGEKKYTIFAKKKRPWS